MKTVSNVMYTDQSDICNTVGMPHDESVSQASFCMVWISLKNTKSS